MKKLSVRTVLVAIGCVAVAGGLIGWIAVLIRTRKEPRSPSWVTISDPLLVPGEGR